MRSHLKCVFELLNVWIQTHLHVRSLHPSLYVQSLSSSASTRRSCSDFCDVVAVRLSSARMEWRPCEMMYRILARRSVWPGIPRGLRGVPSPVAASSRSLYMGNIPLDVRSPVLLYIRQRMSRRRLGCFSMGGKMAWWSASIGADRSLCVLAKPWILAFSEWSCLLIWLGCSCVFWLWHTFCFCGFFSRCLYISRYLAPRYCWKSSACIDFRFFSSNFAIRSRSELIVSARMSVSSLSTGIALITWLLEPPFVFITMSNLNGESDLSGPSRVSGFVCSTSSLLVVLDVTLPLTSGTSRSISLRLAVVRSCIKSVTFDEFRLGDAKDVTSMPGNVWRLFERNTDSISVSTNRPRLLKLSYRSSSSGVYGRRLCLIIRHLASNQKADYTLISEKVADHAAVTC